MDAANGVWFATIALSHVSMPEHENAIHSARAMLSVLVDPADANDFDGPFVRSFGDQFAFAQRLLGQESRRLEAELGPCDGKTPDTVSIKSPTMRMRGRQLIVEAVVSMLEACAPVLVADPVACLAVAV